MRPAVVVSMVLGLGALVAPATAGAARSAGTREVRPFFDSRAGAAAKVPARSAAGRSALRSRLGRSGVLAVDPVTNTPRSLLKLNGALSGPEGGDRDAIARGYLRANASALGLSRADVDGLALAKRGAGPGGLTLLRYRQAYRGIPAFDNGARVSLDRAGRVLGVTGSPQHALAVPSVTPKLSAAEAMRALQRSVGVARDVRVTGGPAGARRTTRFVSGEQARLTLFGAAGGPRLAWRVDYRASTREHYDGVVDAATGRLLWRANRVKEYSANVFDYYAGAPEGGDLRVQDLTTPGWLPDGASKLDGPATHTWTDVNDDNEAQALEEVTPESGDFQFDFTPFDNPDPPERCTPQHVCTWDPVNDRSSWQVNRKQSATEAFFLVSKYHDHLASGPIGFTDASGNFEDEDKVLTNSLDGADTAGDGGPDIDHVDNANMDTPPDGQSPTLQLYLFEYLDDLPQFDYNGDDAATVWHEYTHGLSNRLVVDEEGVGALNSPHAGAMGEAWSDWYAEDLLVRQGFESDDPAVAGEIDVGEPADAAPHVTRSEAIDCAVEDTDQEDACPGGVATGPGGYTFGDFGSIAGVPEVHADGEIWVQTLWDLRRALVAAAGSDAAGSDEAERLITNGMRLAPPEPSMLDMRNAILQADTANGGGRHALVWAVFAHRGMGFYASAFDGADTHPAESFEVPPAGGTPTGGLRGTVTDSQTGAPLPGVTVRIGAATDEQDEALLTDLTDAAGRYEISGVTEGTYGKLAVRPPGGYDPLDVPDVEVQGDTTVTKDVKLDRNWASKAGGASVVFVNDGLGDDVGCGPEQLIDDTDLYGWVADNPPAGQPKPVATFALPKAVEVSAIAIDPAPGCYFLGASAALKDYKLEVSSDGSTFRPYAAGAFGAAEGGQLNRLESSGGAGKNVKQVRLTMIQSQDQCDGCTGAQYISASRLEVFGAPAPPVHVEPTPNPGGGGGGTTSTPPSALPKITLAKSGKKGSYTLRVTCAERCKLSGKLTVSRKVARALGRKKLTLRTVKRTITTTARKTYRVKLSKSVLKALKQHHLKSVLVKARFTATYADGRKKTASRRVRIRR